MSVESAKADIPADWRRGELLDCRSNGQGYEITRLGIDENPVIFPSSFQAQAFISWWYAPPQVIQ